MMPKQKHNVLINTSKLARNGRLIVLFGCLISLTACSTDQMQDLREFVQETKTKYKGQVEPLPAVVPYESYRYSVAKQRDPFRPSMSLVKSVNMARNANGITPDTRRNREELERYELDSLSMVGIMVNEGEKWAIVRAPDGAIYRVRKGNYMGRNHGKIIKINETKVEIKEIIADGLGGWIERPNKISLAQ